MKIKISLMAFIFITAILYSCSSTEKKAEIPEKVKDGPGKIYWEDGSLKGRGNFINFQKDGKWTLFHKDSTSKLAEGNYLNDKQNGNWIFFHRNGVKSLEGSFENDQKTGLWIAYYETSEKLWEARYVIRTTDMGKIGGMEGKKITYYPSGSVKMEEEYVKGEKKGRSQEFYENGTPKEISWFSDDKHNGKSNVYWPNGKLKEQGIFQGGLRNGDWKFFYDNGQLQMAGNFIIGKLDIKGEEQTLSQMNGKWQYFSKEGHLQKEGNYEKSKEIGFWRFYSYKNNVRQLKMELELKGGMAAGKGKIYENGSLAGEGGLMGTVKALYIKLVNGKEAGEEQFSETPPDNPKGNISYKWNGNWSMPRINGLWSEYHPGGKNIKTEANYMMGKLSGKYKEYFSNGRIKAEGEYMNGKKNGMWKVYNENGTLNKEESGRWMIGKKSKVQ
ncbi:MAG: hypothetical protein JXN64_02525 [Spirochaetes bacterium]|nr:hypothetical protein [Spirochaetota bacterium]